MDELILRVLNGTATAFERERLKRWRAQDPANDQRARELEALWRMTDAGTGDPAEPDTVEGLAATIMLSAEARRDAARGDLPARRGRKSALRHPVPWAAALAAGVAALVLGLGRWHTGPLTPAPEDPPPPVTAEAPSAPQTLRLDDGSFVRLAPGSRLQVHLREGLREVRLEGRGFFAVAPDPTRPFLVRTGDTQVRVLGTRFEVAQTEEGVRAVVVEGRVALSSPAGLVEVPEGSVGQAPLQGPPTARIVEDVLSLLEWPGGLLVFHGTPLRQVALEVERHFGIPVRILDRELGERGVSASFNAHETFSEVLETLCVVTAASCSVSADSAALALSTGESR